MLDLKNKNDFESNLDIITKEVTKLNQLDVDNCLFTPELLATLLKCPVKCSKSQSQVIKNKEGIYLIVFRVFNNKKISLIYNYIYYNDLFYLILIVYLLLINYFEYSKILYNDICPNKFINLKNIINKDVELTNPFNKLLFVVQDKEALLKNISDKGYIINQGPQQ